MNSEAGRILVSVVVCTRNRSELLRGGLDRLIDQDMAPDAYEVLVVDNGSTDGTRRMVGDAIQRSEGRNIVYVYEGRAGLSNARNTGIAAARGAVISFIDDDAVADRAWVSTIARFFTEHPDAEVVGGPVRPVWEAPAPPWLSQGLQGYVDVMDYGPKPRRLAWPEVPCGTNCSFRKSVFDSVGTFDPMLGRVGKSLLSAEEVELIWRVVDRGGAVYYSPGAIVHHLVPASRLTKRFFRRRILWGARSDARYEIKHRGMAYVSRRALRGLSRVPYYAILAGYHRLRMDLQRSFDRQHHCLLTLGYAWEAFRWLGRSY